VAVKGAEWSRAEQARLGELAADEQLSASGIATLLTDQFGRDFSRAAVLGQAHRRGISIGPPRATPTAARAAERRAAAQRLASAPAKARPRSAATKVMAPPPAGHQAGDPWPDDKVHWPGAEAPPHGRECQWPIGLVGDADFGFCGRRVAARIKGVSAPAGGFTAWLVRTYCVAHARRAARPTAWAGDDGA